MTADQPVRPFGSGREQLGAHLERVLLLVQRFLKRHHARFVESPAGGLHTFVTVHEVDTILKPGDPPEPIDAEPLRAAEADLAAREAAPAASARRPALSRLVERLGLDAVGRDLVVAVAAPDVSVDVHRAYRHAWADFTARHGNVLFFEELLAEAGHRPEDVRRWLANGSPLVRYGLLMLLSEESDLGAPPPPSMTRVLASPRLVTFLLDQPLDPSELPLAVQVRRPRGEQPMSTELVDRARGAWSWAHAGHRRRVLLEGPEGAGRRSLIERFSDGLVSLDVAVLPEDPEAIAAAWQLALSEARLAGAALFVNGLDALLTEGELGQPALILLDRLQREPGPVFLGVERTSRALTALVGRVAGSLVHLEVPFPGVDAQRAVWRESIPTDVALEPDLVPEALAGRYNLTGGKIRAAISNAVATASLSGGHPVRLTSQALTDAVRAQLAHRLGDLATRVHTPFTRDDLILGPDSVERIEEILIHYRQRSKLLYSWGFDRLLAYGRGLTALFSGPPGTGKTMAAAVIARELGMEIFQVDLSQLVDKYIGETEKKMARIFDEAGRGQAILLFDEADSVFAKRTEVRNSTDRYANLGVNFLLQRMESYEGITILTTNLESSIDEAFKRRIRFRVNFTAPNAEAREALWRSMIPPAAPCEPDIDFEDLAWDFELVGADIKTVVYKAAALAAELQLPISYDLLRQSARLLYRERGKVVRDDE